MKHAVWLLLLLLPAFALRKPCPDKPAESEGISAETIQTRLKQLDDAKDIEDAVKQKIRDYYQQALAELEGFKNRATRIAKYEQMAATAASELQKAKSLVVAAPAPTAAELPPDDMAIVQIDQLISKKQSELDEARAKLTAAEAEPNNRAARRLDIPKKTSECETTRQLEEQLRPRRPRANLQQ